MGDAFCQRVPDMAKAEMTRHGFARLEVRKPHAGYYQVVYTEALTVEGALIVAGVLRTKSRPRRRRIKFASSLSPRLATARDAVTTTRGAAIPDAAAAARVR